MKTDNVARRMRTRVARAFRRMARAVKSSAAYASTVQYYRAAGHAWSRQLD